MDSKIIKQSESFFKVFPSRLRALLAEGGESQKELGDAIGKKRQVISQYCLGKTEPELDTLVKIAYHFSVTVDYLVGAEDAKRHDVDDIASWTGLDVETIDHLISIREESEIVPMTPKAMNAKTILESIDLFFLHADVETVSCSFAEWANSVSREIDFVQSEHGAEYEAVKDSPEAILHKWSDVDNISLEEFTKRRELQHTNMGRRYALIKSVEDFLDNMEMFMIVNPASWEAANGKGEE